MRKYRDHGLEKHRKLQALNSDWNSSGRILTSDVKQHGRETDFEEKRSEPQDHREVFKPSSDHRDWQYSNLIDWIY